MKFNLNSVLGLFNDNNNSKTQLDWEAKSYHLLHFEH